MTTAHPTPDPTPENTTYRQKCEREFGLSVVPHERNRYPTGYWRACYEELKKEENVSHETLK